MNKKKGFTLAELLIVVAIIAVLVGVALPVFTGQLEKSKEATDMANMRACYATAVVSVLENGKVTSSATVDASGDSSGSITEGAMTCTATYTLSTDTVEVTVDTGGKSVAFGTGAKYTDGGFTPVSGKTPKTTDYPHKSE